METKTEDIEKLSPERLMRMFSRSPIILAWILSIIVHLGLGAATSWEYAYKRYIAPEKEVEKAVGETNALASATGTVAGATGTVATATGAVVAAGAPTNVPAAGTNLTTVATNELIEGTAAYEAAMLKKYSNSAVVKEITAVASSNEIPKGPTDDLGISIKETDPFHK